MIQRKSKYFIFVFVLILTMAFIAGCGKKEDSSKNTNTTKKDNKTTATTNSKSQNNSENVTKKPVKVEKRMVDGYDIGPATSGTKLKDAYKDYFSIGLAMAGYSNENSTVNSKALTEIIKYHANSTTLTNFMKPSSLLDQNGSMENIKNGIDAPAVNFDNITDELDFCKENGIKMRGHTLVWHTQVPDWFFCKDYESGKGYVDHDTMLLRMESYIKQVLEYTQKNYPGVIYCWDVVNEAVETATNCYETKTGYNIRTKHGDASNLMDNLWYKVIGPDYVEKAFEYARKYAAKEVKLYYNDYNTSMPAKNEKICALLTDLKKKGLVDGIGMQGYMDTSYPGIYAGTDNVLAEIKKYAEIGLEIQYTELTLKEKENTPEEEKKQAERYGKLFTLLLQLDDSNGGPANIVNVTMFGIMDEYLFYDPSNDKEHSRIFNGKLQPKPAFYSILSVGENAKNIKPMKTFTPVER